MPSSSLYNEADSDDEQSSISSNSRGTSILSSSSSSSSVPPSSHSLKRPYEDVCAEDSDSDDENKSDSNKPSAEKRAKCFPSSTSFISSAVPTTAPVHHCQQDGEEEAEEEEEDQDDYDDEDGAYVDEDEDAFDPFYFIATLPERWDPPPNRRALPPRDPHPCYVGACGHSRQQNGQSPHCLPEKLTLVLDLDETLVHCSTEPMPDCELTFPVVYRGVEYSVSVRRRPYFQEFLEFASRHFEVVIFTASQEIYASQLLNLLDPENRLVHHRFYRDSCVFVDGNYVKDLNVIGRHLHRTVIVDNSPQAFGFQIENGVPIESWYSDPSDCELMKLIPFLESLKNVPDVRPHVLRHFRLAEKVQAAVTRRNRFARRAATLLARMLPTPQQIMLAARAEVDEQSDDQDDNDHEDDGQDLPVQYRSATAQDHDSNMSSSVCSSSSSSAAAAAAAAAAFVSSGVAVLRRMGSFQDEDNVDDDDDDDDGEGEGDFDEPAHTNAAYFGVAAVAAAAVGQSVAHAQASEEAEDEGEEKEEEEEEDEADSELEPLRLGAGIEIEDQHQQLQLATEQHQVRLPSIVSAAAARSSNSSLQKQQIEHPHHKQNSTESHAGMLEFLQAQLSEGENSILGSSSDSEKSSHISSIAESTSSHSLAAAPGIEQQ